MKNAYDHEGYIHALDLLVPFIAMVCILPAYIRPLFFASGAILPHVCKALGALKHIEAASEACIAQRRCDLTRQTAQGQRDMLDGFFNLLHSKREETDFTMTEIKLEVYGAL